jgi:hypothetical protein
MDMMNWSLMDVIVEQKRYEAMEERQRVLLLEQTDNSAGGVRPAVARALVHLGLRLDPNAAEGAGTAQLVSARK